MRKLGYAIFICKSHYLCVLLSFCFALLSLPSYSQEKEVLDVKSSKKILVVGDSLSAAYKLAEKDGWVHLMAQRFQQRGQSVDVVNASVSGATTAAGLQLMPDALATHKPDLLILQLGANDGLQGKPVPYITRNLSRLIELGKKAEATVVLVGIRLPPNFGKRYTEPFFGQYAALAEKYQLNLVPFLLEGVAGKSELMMDDGLHPNAQAQALVLENVWPVVVPALQL